MKYKAFIDSNYAELCKEYGHLAYHKMVLEKKLKELEQKIAGLDSISKNAENLDKLQERAAKNEGSNENS
jgi:hypothetical protein